MSNIERLDETVKEEADGVHNSLAIVENIVEFRPEVCKDVASSGEFSRLDGAGTMVIRDNDEDIARIPYVVGEETEGEGSVRRQQAVR